MSLSALALKVILTAEEVAAAEQSGFISVSLGNAVLRAETASIVAAVTIKTINELS
jgi:RsmE family RNA methyltransferase